MSNWTPGPWAYENTLDYDGDLHEWISCPDGDTPWRCETSPDRTPEASRANHELIALAPEMAEAIIAIADTLKGYGPDYEQKPICVLADKLRAIGGDNE